jgi:hypothetical protein
MTSEGNRKLPSLDLVFELSKSQEELVWKSAESNDSKVIALFSISSLVLGAVLALQPEHLELDLKLIPFAIALLSFVLTVYFSFRSFQVRTFILGHHPSTLLDQYASMETDEAKRQLIKYYGDNFDFNSQVLGEKATYLSWAIVTSALEVIGLAVWLLVVFV